MFAEVLFHNNPVAKIELVGDTLHITGKDAKFVHDLLQEDFLLYADGKPKTLNIKDTPEEMFYNLDKLITGSYWRVTELQYDDEELKMLGMTKEDFADEEED